MNKLDKLKEQLNTYLEMLERAGADARFDNDREYYDSLIQQLDGAIHWSEKAKATIKKIKKESEGNK